MTVFHKIFGLGYGFLFQVLFAVLFGVIGIKTARLLRKSVAHLVLRSVHVRKANTIPTFKKIMLRPNFKNLSRCSIGTSFLRFNDAG